VLGIPEKVDRFTLEGKAALAKLFQDLTAVIDSLGLCLFTSFAIGADDFRDLYNTFAGADWTTAEMLAAGERIWNMERLFNLAAGIDPSEDKLPKRLLAEPIAEGPSKGHVHRLAELLPQYYQLRGWDPNGIPTQERLVALQLT
jgi:aldehyde:ferredoxin oxidoreductase